MHRKGNKAGDDGNTYKQCSRTKRAPEAEERRVEARNAFFAVPLQSALWPFFDPLGGWNASRNEYADYLSFPGEGWIGCHGVYARFFSVRLYHVKTQYHLSRAPHSPCANEELCGKCVRYLLAALPSIFCWQSNQWKVGTCQWDFSLCK